LRKHSAEIRQEHDNLQAIFDAAQVGFLLVNQKTEVTCINEATARMIGKEAAHVLGRQPGDVLSCIFALMAPGGCGTNEACQKCPIRMSVTRVLKTKETVQGLEVQHALAVHGEICFFWFLISVSQLTFNGAPHALLAISDITEQKKAEESLLAANERLEIQKIALESQRQEMVAANEQLTFHTAALEDANKALEESNRIAESATRAKSEFLANMSHEIRTPMTAIMGYADILVRDKGFKEAPEHWRKALEIIKRNGEHLLRLLNDILDLSKVETGKLQIELVSSSPSQVVADVVSLMCIRADAKGLKLITEFVSPLPETILTDPLRLRQILVNLVGNAIKFTKSGEVRITVRFVSGSVPKQLVFDVTDTGIGMEQRQIMNIFRPFSQLDSSASREFGGTGLGLAISKRLVEAMNGRIEVHSKPGEGSTFSVIIDPGPVDGICMVPQSRETAIQPQSAETTHDAGSIDLHGRILFAEDGLDNQQLVRLLLEKAGANVTTCENGLLAVEAAMASKEAGQPFDMIIMDMQMPVMDGYIATRQLREKGYTGPIIALTANAMIEDRQKCIDAGCDDYFAKPFDRNQILNAIARCIEKNVVSRKEATKTISEPLKTQCDWSRLHARVLIAEDTLDVQNLIEDLLTAAGAEVTAVDNGQLAVEKVTAARRDGKPFDLILMDMQMPVMDGYDATRQLRSEGYRGRIVALTAHSMTKDRQKCLESGCDDFVTKPIDSNLLIKIVEESARASRDESNTVHSEKAAIPPQSAGGALHSQHADNPVFARRLCEFVSRLDGRVQAMKAAIDNSQANELQSLAHQLKGSAGSYGYPSLAEAASALEEALKIGRLDAAPKILDQVAALCRDIEKSAESLVKFPSKGIDTLKTTRLLCDSNPHASEGAATVAKFKLLEPKMPMHILVVDDDLDMLGLLEDIIKERFSKNARVELVSSSQKARERLEAGLIDVLITDIEMPDLNGLQLLRFAKRKNAWTQVVVITGHSQMEVLTDAMDLGASDYLVKPIDPEELEQSLHEAFSRFHRWRQSLARTIVSHPISLCR
jgi:CheY-like chemotaxis protein/signal transduction histidine kinase/HPt (histidine-containing phosphotransfer) domain-containing protein